MASTSLSDLEYGRARRALEHFCAQRSGVQGRQLACRVEGSDILIVETGRRVAAGFSEETVRALVRLRYADRAWRVFWSRDNGVWEPYRPLPVTESIIHVIHELEQAPLHIHWG